MAVPLSLADQVCLAVIGEGGTHGWAIVKLLSHDGEIGRVWTLSRALTYRSIDRLVDAGLVDRADEGRRAHLSITPSGRRIRTRWLAEPVAHLRDLRTVFLLKLTLCDRSGSGTPELIDAQRSALRPAIEALTGQFPTDAVELWRHEAALAAARFLEQVGRA